MRHITYPNERSRTAINIITLLVTITIWAICFTLIYIKY